MSACNDSLETDAFHFPLAMIKAATLYYVLKSGNSGIRHDSDDHCHQDLSTTNVVNHVGSLQKLCWYAIRDTECDHPAT